MSFFSKLFNGHDDESQDADIRQKISEAVALKRKGNFEDSKSIYNDLISKYPNDPRAYKSLGKVLVCMGQYDSAIKTFEFGAKLYEELGASGEAWQCMDQAQTVQNRDIDPDDFYSYAMGCAGGAPGFSPKT